MRVSPALLLAAALSTLAGPAPAQTVAEGRNFSAERFRLSLDKNGILSAEWAAVPEHMSWDVSLWLGYADDPVALYRDVDGQRERLGALVDARVGGGLVVALALFDRVQLGLELPLVLYQDRQDTLPGLSGTLDPLNRFGVGAPRFSPKVKLLDEERHGVAMSFMPTFVMPAAGQAAYLGQDSLLFEPEMLLSKAFGLWRSTFGLGLRLRRPTELSDLEVDDEIFARLAGGLSFAQVGGPPVEVEAVLSAAAALEAPFAERSQNHLEALLGAAYDLSGPLLAFAAAGIGLNQGFSTPDWRVLAGVRVSEHERDRDHDGLKDELDDCPELPEDLDGFDDEDGCPEPDNDRDGLVDRDDRAPLGAEDVDGFEDDDGIPDPDNDGDGVWDWDDGCPLEPGPAVNLGCPDVDRDADGLVDRLDACADAPEDRDGFEDEDGCPDPDDDGDGLKDAQDRCPREAGPEVNRGCPDADGDGDGVVDRLDNCPAEPGEPDHQGCTAPQKVAIVGDRLQILDRVYFAAGRARIRPRSFGLLDDVARVLKGHPEIAKVEVQGHTDDQGRPASNRRLSQRRAEAVRDYLVRAGVAAERLAPKGYGEARPIAPNDTREGRAENRRVEFVVTGRR